MCAQLGWKQFSKVSMGKFHAAFEGAKVKLNATHLSSSSLLFSYCPFYVRRAAPSPPSSCSINPPSLLLTLLGRPLPFVFPFSIPCRASERKRSKSKAKTMANKARDTHTHTHKHVSVLTCKCASVSLCVCVCARWTHVHSCVQPSEVYGANKMYFMLP